jgi:hypothetical protein
METEVATFILADILRYRAHPAVEAKVIERCFALMQKARAWGLQKDWKRAATAIQQAYAALGSHAPFGIDHGYLFHVRKHPVHKAGGLDHESDK